MGGPHELAGASAAAERGYTALVALLRSGLDPGARVSDAWTVRDVAGHVLVGLEVYTGIVEGKGSPLQSLAGMDALNAAQLASVGADLDLPQLVERIEPAMAGLLAALRRAGEDPEISWHEGIRVPVSTAAAGLVCEAYLHGLDVARACRRPWTIPPSDARAAMHGIFPVLPHFVDAERARGVRARIELRLRDDDRHWLLSFDDGELHVGPPDGHRADCTILASPVPFLLVSYGRGSALAAGARGQVLAWGRRPWLGLRLPALIASP